jgi:hypothetical protein
VGQVRRKYIRNIEQEQKEEKNMIKREGNESIRK